MGPALLSTDSSSSLSDWFSGLIALNEFSMMAVNRFSIIMFSCCSSPWSSFSGLNDVSSSLSWDWCISFKREELHQLLLFVAVNYKQ